MVGPYSKVNEWLMFGDDIPVTVKEVKKSGYVSTQIARSQLKSLVQLYMDNPGQYNNLYLESVLK